MTLCTPGKLADKTGVASAKIKSVLTNHSWLNDWGYRRTWIKAREAGFDVGRDGVVYNLRTVQDEKTSLNCRFWQLGTVCLSGWYWSSKR